MLNDGPAEDQANELILRLIIKPLSVLPDDKTRELLAILQHHSSATTLSYEQPMSMGAHVISLEPPLAREAAEALAVVLSALPELDYVEPDYPRYRR